MKKRKSPSLVTIRLYGYQQIALKKIVAALKRTARALLVMATGLGKTILSIEVVKEFITPKDKVIFLCHDNGILNKAYKDYKKYIGGNYTFTKFYGQTKDWEADKHHFVFATFQSIVAHLNNRKQKRKLFSRKHFSFIVVDESHHSQAETYAEVINYFKPKYKLGMTATPNRDDNADIREIFGKEVVNILLPEAIAKSWLVNIDYKVLSDGLDEEKIHAVCRTVLEDNVYLTEKQINEKIFIKVRTKEQCRIVQQYSKKQKAIIFCENIEHLKHVASILPSSAAIHSKQNQKINDNNFHLFEQGLIRHILVVDKFNEGIDIPDTELLVFLRTTNSERIFLQQLGRGLRPVLGKDKVTVLDFVANIDRIRQVSKLTHEIESVAKIHRKKKSSGNGAPLHVEGKGFSFDFTKEVVNILSVFDKVSAPFYKTWQEASKAARKLKIKSSTEYVKKHRKDFQLPTAPYHKYANFPGWHKFLGNIPRNFYRTWQEASKAARKLGITREREYAKKAKLDPRLPRSPRYVYKNFPGFKVFLGQEFYKTWQEASKATIRLKVKDRKDYYKKFRKDPRLRTTVESYKGFPGWKVFLGKSQKNFYRTWQQASKAASKLGITQTKDYYLKFKKDPRLPSNPHHTYKDFPSWRVFLGKGALYPTWKIASKALRKLKITNRNEYFAKKFKDEKLPSSPNIYYKDFPGWSKYLKGR